MTLKINDKKERVYELTCATDGCGKVGGTITFKENHGRESDEALEAELNAKYTHTCEAHSTA
jgi:hypothetical protein